MRLACYTTALAILATAPANALSPETDARGGMTVFAENCFSPFMTAEKADEVLALANIRYDFYDLDPFSNVDSSPVTGRPATPGTDRRCEVAFNGNYATEAAEAAVGALKSEGILTPADVPARHRAMETQGTELLAARRLNPHRIAVVHVGTRPGPMGMEETFMYVERLRPEGE